MDSTLNPIIEVTIGKTSYLAGEKAKIRVHISDSALDEQDDVTFQLLVTSRTDGRVCQSAGLSAHPNSHQIYEINTDPAIYTPGAYRVTAIYAAKSSSAVFHITESLPKGRTLVIVFWDLSNFSKLCHIMKARNDLIFDFLAEYFSLAKEIISKYDGVIDKFIGDGIMSIFGLASSDADETQMSVNAVDAAIEFRKAFENEIWRRWKKKFQSHAEEGIGEVQLKCGINTGECLVGWVGADELNRSFTALGNTVNIASRMEGLAKQDQIIVTERTASLLEGLFILNKVGSSNLNLEKKSHKGEQFSYYEIIQKIHQTTDDAAKTI